MFVGMHLRKYSWRAKKACDRGAHAADTVLRNFLPPPLLDQISTYLHVNKGREAKRREEEEFIFNKRSSLAFSIVRLLIKCLFFEFY
jgi:hypothetical protein